MVCAAASSAPTEAVTSTPAAGTAWRIRPDGAPPVRGAAALAAPLGAMRVEPSTDFRPVASRGSITSASVRPTSPAGQVA